MLFYRFRRINKRIQATKNWVLSLFKRNLKILIIVSLIIALILPSFLSFVSSSTGNIRINSQTSSALGQQVQAGGNINLYFGGVMWSGDQFYLFLSPDGSSQLSSGLVYTPTFSVYNVADTTINTNYTTDSGVWLTGNNWVNGTIPSTVSLGRYYVKAIDQIGSSVAVTDTYITVNPVVYSTSLNISPSSGPGGVPITFTGSGYPVGQNVTISYLDPVFGSWNLLAYTTANSLGMITVDSVVPDLKKSLGSSDYPETYTSISYRSAIGNQILSSASFNQYQRGLKTVGNSTAYGLYGNGTNLVSSVRTIIGDSIALSGKAFHPGIIYIRWDSVNVVGTVSSNEWLNANIIGTTVTNGNGSFSTSVIIPNANAGEHYIAVEDSQNVRVIVKVFVSSASLQLSPASGPGGANVQFTGLGYPASTLVTVSYLDPNFGSWNFWTSTSSDSTGKISFNAEIPDLRRSAGNGEFSNGSTLISFRTEINSIPFSYSDYTQYWRGLSQVGSRVASSLFGNGTDLSPVNATPGNSLLISGKWFHPGIVYIRFDGIAVVGTVTADEWQNAQIIGSTTASSTGSFSTTGTIPSASGGVHYLSIEDSQTRVIIRINILAPVIPTPTPTPIPNTMPTASPTPKPIPTPNPSLPTPTIDVSCKSTTTLSGFKVSINGNLMLNGNPLSNQPVLVSYSVTDGNTWESLTLIKTSSDGSFVAVWTPSVTGNYLVKAAIEKTSTMNEASKIINLALTPDAEQNVFTLTSNSTITQFAFNSTSNQLSFIASGPSNTKGYVNLYIPKTLISDISQLKAYIDGNEISFNSESQGDFWFISFGYSHSQHTITMAIQSESSALTKNDSYSQYLIYVIPFAIVAFILAVVVALKRRGKPANPL